MGLTRKSFAQADSGKGSLWIEQNHCDYERRADGLYIHSDDAFGAQSIDDIPAMIETLQAIYDEFEKNKPKYLPEVLGDLPSGTVIKFDRDYDEEYVKIGYKWFNPRWPIGSTGNEFRDWLAEEWTFKIKYNPKEAN